jgi:hypothetical protein
LKTRKVGDLLENTGVDVMMLKWALRNDKGRELKRFIWLRKNTVSRI